MTHILSPAHRKMLEEESGIAPEVIAARGYRTLTQPADVEALGFADFQAATARRAPVLALPLWNVQGQQDGWQLRPDKPRLATDKRKHTRKEAKYETPYQGQVSLDVHPHVQPLLRDPTVPLWVTEGVKKGDALVSRGACAIALMGGVDGFQVPDWEHVTLTQRHVCIVYDSDVMEKKEVKGALRRLVQFLTEQEATVQVQVATLPSVDGAKVGVDDFLLTHTLQDLEGLLQAPRRVPANASPRHQPPAPSPAVDPAAQLGTVSPCTHVANAKRLITRYQPTLRYVLGLGWILWTGQFWRPDPTNDDALALGFVSGLALTIAEEAATLFAAAGQTPSAAERKALYALALERGQWAVHSEQRGTIASGLALAKHALLLDHEQINPDPWLFNCQNGTLDLHTGTLTPHDPADLITHLAPVTYDPAATCPTWTQFLREVFAGDQSMVDFLQRAIGSSLTGVVQDRALFLLYGAQGHNGKTTLVEVLRDLLGTSGEEGFGYARKVDVMTFMKSKNYEDNLRKAAQLAGARFVYSSEIDEEHRLNEQLIKDMTGGDTMEARRLYKEAFNFKPTFKPWLYGNHKPEIRGTDDALWGRVKLIEFPVSFADRVNLHLPAELRAELSGILNWALVGGLAWQREGLNPPAKVQADTQSYRKEQDTIGQFISECCETGEDYLQCKAAALYAAYRRWAEASDAPTLSQKRFGTYLTAHGYPSDDNATGRGIFRRKIALKALAEDDEEAAADDDRTTNLRHARLAATKASNGAVKPHFDLLHANLPNLTLGKSPRRDSLGGLPGTKVSKVSNSPDDNDYPIEKEGESTANLPRAKVSTPAPAQGAVSPSYCPGCSRNSTWLLREGLEVCYKCGTQKPSRPEGMK
jgi:putative DNA primase/helicase